MSAANGLFKLFKFIGLGLLAIFILVLIVSYIQSQWLFWDNDKDRGATSIGMAQPDSMGDHFSEVVYPDQGWSPAESLYFYNTTQGSNLIPYDFMMVLEQANSTERLLEPSNVNRYRYLVQKKTDSNPDALPVGFVKDSYTDLAGNHRTYMGYTCAACHTSQVVVQKDAQSPFLGVRVDGGPAAADMPNFLAAIRRSLSRTLQDEAKNARFTQAVLARGEYKNAKEVHDDLLRFLLRFQMYDVINKSLYKEQGSDKKKTVNYGYARLDAFGRIFNRVIEHLITSNQIRAVLFSIPGLTEEQRDKINGFIPQPGELLSARERENILRDTYLLLTQSGKKPNEAIRAIVKAFRDGGVFNFANAPVSYPFLWDIVQHDYVQWNGIAANSSVGPLGRNVGEVIGVFATLDWHQTEDCGIGGRVTGQCSLFGEPTKEELIRFTSSVNMRNLQRLEALLTKLQSPLWSDANIASAMPMIGQMACELLAKGETNSVGLEQQCAQHQQGREIFVERCVMCHHDIKRDDKNRKVVAFMGNVDTVGTDPAMALNSVTYKGKSGLLQDLYVNASGGDGKLVMQEEMPVASLLTFATQGVVATPDPDKNSLVAGFEWLVDILASMDENPITKSTNRQGDYPEATEANPFQSLKAYKGRPLNGIWATAPYLHNGSVPTLYHLLLPAECPQGQLNCVEGKDKRPASFLVGSRVLDTELVGFKYQGYKGGFEFDTSLRGNSNKGHEYAACGTAIPGKRLEDCVPLDHAQRMALVEYMKSL